MMKTHPSQSHLESRVRPVDSIEIPLHECFFFFFFFFLQKTNLKAVYTKNNKLYICYIMIQKRKHEYFLTIIKVLLGFDLKVLKLSSK